MLFVNLYLLVRSSLWNCMNWFLCYCTECSASLELCSLRVFSSVFDTMDRLGSALGRCNKTQMYPHKLSLWHFISLFNIQGDIKAASSSVCSVEVSVRSHSRPPASHAPGGASRRGVHGTGKWVRLQCVPPPSQLTRRPVIQADLLLLTARRTRWCRAPRGEAAQESGASVELRKIWRRYMSVCVWCYGDSRINDPF